MIITIFTNKTEDEPATNITFEIDLETIYATVSINYLSLMNVVFSKWNDCQLHSISTVTLRDQNLRPPRALICFRF